jgi:hypothetical protein
VSTRSGIGIVDRDIRGKLVRVRGVYCHWDGYLEHNGVILGGSYRNTDKINALIGLGDLSVLRNEVGEKHDFNNMKRDAPQRVNGWTTAYHRDRGDELRQRVFDGPKAKSLFRSALRDSWAEYIYLYDLGKWYWSRPDGKRWLVLGNKYQPVEV